MVFETVNLEGIFKMVRIVSDTSTLYSSKQANEKGFDVAPLSVTIAGNSYKEFNEITTPEFVNIIKQGHLPTSSQPAIGDVVALFEKYPDDEILNISMAKGLSGTYDSAVTAAGLCENSDRITVINTRTLCGPHRYLVEKAVELAKNGLNKEEILAQLKTGLESHKSFLMPADFDYLRRGGRLSPLVSYVGKFAGLVPIMTQTEDGEQLAKYSVQRGFKNAISHLVKKFEEYNVGKGWRVYITHADAPHLAQQAKEIIMEKISDAVFEIYPLSPAFVTQGGPGCVAVQVIKE